MAWFKHLSDLDYEQFDSFKYSVLEGHSKKLISSPELWVKWHTKISHLFVTFIIVSRIVICFFPIMLACVIPINPQSLLHFKLLHNGMLGIVVLAKRWLPLVDTMYTYKSMGMVLCHCFRHLFIHPATISTHQEYLPIPKHLDSSHYPYCSSYWEIRIFLTAK